MTEAEWFACTDAGEMLSHLDSSRTGLRKVRRQLRLFACACCRQVWHLTTDECFRKAVEVCELFADGKATTNQLDAAIDALRPAFREADEAKARALASMPPEASDEEREFSQKITAELPGRILSVVGDTAAWVLKSARPRDAGLAAWSVAAFADLVIHDSQLTLATYVPEPGRLHSGRPNITHCHLLRDIVGTPFRSFLVSPSWLRWNDGTIPKIAQRIYDERDFSLMPILADALEDAGCDNEDILRHCREPGEHVRGCWVVDLLFGKK